MLDEPQNLESERARAAIASLGPLCTLRYSATHKHVYNLLYQLDPVRAFELKLVKAIEVDSVREEGDFNRPYVRFKQASPGARVSSRRKSQRPPRLRRNSPAEATSLCAAMICANAGKGYGAPVV